MDELRNQERLFQDRGDKKAFLIVLLICIAGFCRASLLQEFINGENYILGMIDAMLVGAVGGIAIIVSWMYETLEAIKRHKSLIDLKFSALNIFGVLLLILYSWQIENAVFMYLNIVLFSIELIEIAYSIAVKKMHRKKR